MTAGVDAVCRRVEWARIGQVVLDGLQHPIVLAPLAGGASTPELTAAVSEAGGLGFLASGYLSTDALEERIARVRELTDAPFGVNLFVPGDPDAPTEGLEDYLRRVAPEASRYGAGVGEARYDDDGYLDKLALIESRRPAVASFTFGCPEPERIESLNAARVEVWVTVTSPREARVAANAGADVLVLQGSEAGGHRASFADSDEEPLSTLVLLRLVGRKTGCSSRSTLASRLPLVASGGLTDGPAVAAALAAGASAAQLGTAFLAADEASIEPAYRKALRSSTPTALTRAFSGRRARGIVNRFMADHSEGAPAAYPHVHYATSPLRAAARKRGDPDGFNLWAGQAHELAPSGPAAEILRSISADARRALEDAANRAL
jgi:nitronate monooxygenase